jgi:NodT family efflux transporter outer membrane factor (OMF) lipoprotein
LLIKGYKIVAIMQKKSLKVKQNMKIAGQSFIAICLTLNFIGCTQNNYTLPKDIEKNEKLTQYTDATQENIDQWWENFNDTTLNALIEKSLYQNLSLLATKEQITQAYATLGATKSNLYPSINATASNQRSRDVTQSDEWSKNYSSTVELDFAIDLWGKLRHESKSSYYNYLMTQESYRYSALLLAKEISKQYMTLASYIEKTKLLHEQLKIAKDILNALDIRFNYGKTDYANILEQERQIKILESTITTNNANIISNQKALALLVGKSPIEGLNLRPILPKAGNIPTTGFSSQMLIKRADVRSAYFSLLGADQSAAAALLERFPNINLNFNVTSSALNSGNLFENWLASALGSIVAPIFQGGAIQSNITKKRSLAQEAAYTYADTFMNALGDIEEVSLREKEQKELLKNKKRQIDLMEARVQRVQEQYDNGTLGYIDYIAIIETWHTLKQDYINYKKTYLNAQIDLYFALGSNWLSKEGEKK